MKRVEGTIEVELMECVNPVKDKWRIRWDVRIQDEDGNANYMEEEFEHRPSKEEIRNTIMAWQNEQTNAAILSGYKYDGAIVWLSQENQFNYKSAYDLAVQTKGKSLPVTFKFGSDENPVYCTFHNLKDLETFYTGAVKHIQDTLADGWERKDEFDVEECWF
jgi:hypothetical protein